MNKKVKMMTLIIDFKKPLTKGHVVGMFIGFIFLTVMSVLEISLDELLI